MALGLKSLGFLHGRIHMCDDLKSFLRESFQGKIEFCFHPSRCFGFESDFGGGASISMKVGNLTVISAGSTVYEGFDIDKAIDAFLELLPINS